MKAEKDSVVVLIGGKRLRIDLYNLKDPERAKENKKGGEHYFGFDAAQEAAKAVGKRLMTREEQGLIMELPSRWDNHPRGRWFEFSTPEGNTVEVFFPASGYRDTSGAMCHIGDWGGYWSSPPLGTSYGYSLGFDNGNVGWYGNDRQIGLPVRCVVDEEECEIDNVLDFDLKEMKVERFYDNGEVVIDLEEVGHIEVKPESPKYSHQVIMKYSVWSRENDCYSNDYYFQRDKGYGFEFVEAWKKYKSQQ